jgi:uncharacterized protein YprB with RNaseH-like and TPR domain
MTKLVAPPSLQNVLVTVTPVENPVEGKKKYHVVTDPVILVVKEQNTLINYQIVDTGGYPIVFTGMSVKPANNDQLSEETVSIDKSMLAFFDANTSKMTLNITLHFKDEKKGAEFSHDPQVENDPQG